jgi:hypothetical protein
MNHKIDQLKDSVVFILSKLEDTGKQVRKQEEEIKNYIKKNSTIDFNELVVAHLKSTKTSIELLREEIEELHQLITVFFDEIKGGIEKRQDTTIMDDFHNQKSKNS